MKTEQLSQHHQNKIHPKKFALWVAIASIVMMFVSMTSAYVVRHAQGDWLNFKLPTIFMYSTAIAVLSSVTLHASYVSFKRKKEVPYKVLMVITFILGWAFIISQYQGWVALDAMGVTFTTHVSGSFVYVISGLHAAHVLGGITALVVALVHAFSLKFKVTSVRKLRYEMVITYWHFVTGLWVYLLLFLIMQQA